MYNNRGITKLQGILIAALVTAAAIGGGYYYYFIASVQPEGVTLEFWYPYTRDPAVRARDIVIEAFQKEYPHVKFDNVVTPHVPFAELKAAALTDTMPDLMCINEGMIADFAWANALTPVTEIINKYKSEFAPHFIEQVFVNNEYYAVPWFGNVDGLWYRKDWFENPANKIAFETEYGYGLKAPETWQEFIDVAQFFTRDTNQDGTPDVYGFAAGMAGTHGYFFLMDAIAGNRPINVWDSSGEYAFDTERTRDALEFAAALGPYTYQGSVTTSLIDMRGVWATGGMIAMIPDRFDLMTVIEMLPVQNRSNYAMVPFPGKYKETPAVSNVVMSLAVGKGKHPEMAKKFLEMWMSYPMILDSWKVSEYGWSPVMYNVANNSEYWDPHPYEAAFRPINDLHLTSSYRLGQDIIAGKGPNPWNSAVRGELVYTKLITRIMFDEWSVDDALIAFADAVQTIMDKTPV